MCQVHTGAYIRLITRAWENRLFYRLLPKKDYHVYIITRSIYHYAHVRQTQVNWKKKQRTNKKRKERNEKKRRKRKKKAKKERKEKQRQEKKQEKIREEEARKGKEKKKMNGTD